MFRILIIDDTKSVQAFVKNLLSHSKDIEAESAMNGKEGIDRLQTKNNFDLILLDWEMPVMTGPETFAEMLRLKISIPTIMMTTKNHPDDISKMLSMGVAEYLMKPFTIDILFEKLEFASGRNLPYAA